nr:MULTISPECIES: hypothetical protein [Burkholderia cepacia complex]
MRAQRIEIVRLRMADRRIEAALSMPRSWQVLDRGVSEAKMLECLAKLGRDVQIVVGPDRQSGTEGHIEVVFAA